MHWLFVEKRPVDFNLEDLVSIRTVPSLLPLRSDGKRTTISTIWRWVTKGAAGRRLRAVRVGRDWFTTKQWVKDFVTYSAPQSLPIPEASRAKNQVAILEAEAFLKSR